MARMRMGVKAEGKGMRVRVRAEKVRMRVPGRGGAGFLVIINRFALSAKIFFSEVSNKRARRSRALSRISKFKSNLARFKMYWARIALGSGLVITSFAARLRVWIFTSSLSASKNVVRARVRELE